jgi:ribosomal protein L37E
MSLDRPKLQLDEQSFQRLLAAAFTIQEHADLLKPVTKATPAAGPEPQAGTARVCRKCGAALKENESRCSQCGPQEFSPGERTQGKFASLWEMSQEHGVHREHPPEAGKESVLELASSGWAMAPEATNHAQEPSAIHHNDPPNEAEWATDRTIDVEQTLLSPPPGTTEDNWLTETNHLSGRRWKALLDLRQLLIRRRADIYLGIAVLVAVVALLWPTPAAPQKPRLETWQRVLVTLGIAEAPAPPIHYRGDPNIEVWIDPHTALYYCPGDEPYGKAPDGRLTSQRDAQADQFEPANRAACN